MGKDGAREFGTLPFLASSHIHLHTHACTHTNCQGTPSPPLLPLLASGIRLGQPNTRGLTYFSLMEQLWGLFLGAEMRREEVLTPPNHSEAQEVAAQNFSLEDLHGKPVSSFLVYYHVCENGSTLQPARGLDEAMLPSKGVMPCAAEVLSKVAPCFTTRYYHNLPPSFRPMWIFAQ